jgi:mRNA interferase RelE/StbE
MRKPLAKFELLYTKTAVKDIRKLDRVVKKKIKKKIEKYSKSPLTYARKLVNPSLGDYRWRVGDYRIVFDINRNKVIILRVGQRKEIYS